MRQFAQPGPHDVYTANGPTQREINVPARLKWKVYNHTYNYHVIFITGKFSHFHPVFLLFLFRALPQFWINAHKRRVSDRQGRFTGY